MDTGSAFRHVNDSIRELAPAGAETEALEFLCECRDIACHAVVSLTPLEFDAYRAALPPVPIVAQHSQDREAVAMSPRLVFFYSPTSGRCRRVEGFLAQVLQRRHNHDTFNLVRVSVDERPDLVKRFAVEQVPTLCIVEDGRMTKRITGTRGAGDLQRELSPWLR